MPTRLYFPASGTPPLATLARDANWELPTGNTNPALARLPTFIAKQNTALATSTLTWPATATQQWLWWQFQTEPLKYAYSFALTDYISMVLGKCYETTTAGDTHLAFSLRVVSQDGSVVRGTLLLKHSTSTEYPLAASAATRIHNLAFTAAISAQAGDRLILEIGVHGVTPAAEIIGHRIGDPSALADFALTAGLTTDLCSWWEITNVVEFGAPPAGPTISSASMVDTGRNWDTPSQDISIVFSEAVRKNTGSYNAGDTILGLTAKVNAGANSALTYVSGQTTATWVVRRAELIQQDDVVVLDYVQATGELFDNATNTKELLESANSPVTNNLTKRARFILKKSDNTVVASEIVKYGIFQYDSGVPANANWMTRDTKGTATTSAIGLVDVQYTGAVAVGGPVYVAIIRPDTTPTESMVWTDTVK